MNSIDNMSREKKLRINSILSLINQIVVIVHGLIIPRLFISCYGSTVYGLISSITQFLSVISLMELGMGAVVQSALYAPLANKDNEKISCIIKSSESFFFLDRERVDLLYSAFNDCISNFSKRSIMT